VMGGNAVSGSLGHSGQATWIGRGSATSTIDAVGLSHCVLWFSSRAGRVPPDGHPRQGGAGGALRAMVYSCRGATVATVRLRASPSPGGEFKVTDLPGTPRCCNTCETLSSTLAQAGGWTVSRRLRRDAVRRAPLIGGDRVCAFPPPKRGKAGDEGVDEECARTGGNRDSSSSSSMAYERLSPSIGRVAQHDDAVFGPVLTGLDEREDGVRGSEAKAVVRRHPSRRRIVGGHMTTTFWDGREVRVMATTD